VTRVPRPCRIRQELEAWGSQTGPWPVLRAKPGRPQHEAPRWWRGPRVLRRVEGEYADGQCGPVDLRVLGVHSSSLAHQETTAAAPAPAKAAAQGEAHGQHVTAQH
jgi:hypothetical protein